MKIQAHEIAKVYKARGGLITAVRDWSFEVAQGEFLAILGPSGCGKSTLLRLIAGFEPPTEGEIYHDGTLCNSVISPKRAMVFQDPTLFPWLNTIDNVMVGLKYKGVAKAEAKKVATEYIRIMGLTGFENKLPYELSGGMRQRAMLARTLVGDPDVLLMDEPFASVDAYTREILQIDLLKIWGEKVSPSRRKTIILVTHSIEEAVLLSDRIIVCTHRPARPLSEIKPELARPRSHEMIATPYFIRIRQELSAIMKEQVLKSREIDMAGS